MKQAVFFDFDKTLINCDSQAEEGAYFVRTGRFSLLYIVKIVRVLLAEILYKWHLLKPDQYNALYVKTYKGMNSVWLREQAAIIYQQRLKPSYIPEMIAKMEAHRKNGDLVVVVTATPEHLIEQAQSDLKPDFILSTVLETDVSGFCSGKTVGNICVGKAKAAAIRKLATAKDISLADSYAYSDHHADIEFLQAVGHAAVVNPTRKLLKAAIKEKWKILKY